MLCFGPVVVWVEEFWVDGGRLGFVDGSDGEWKMGGHVVIIYPFNNTHLAREVINNGCWNTTELLKYKLAGKKSLKS